MPDKRLRMVAELQDRASGPMRKIKEASAGIRQTPGMAQARTWMAGFNKEAESFMKGGRGIADVMSGMGIGGLAAAASIGTLVSRFKELGDHTLAMKELGREVGLTTDQVNQFNHAANHFGFDPDKMQGALDHFAGLMPEFRRGYGKLNEVLSKRPDLVKQLRLEDTKTQLKDIFNFLGTIKNPQDRIKFEQDIFGQNVEPLFAEGPDGFEKQLDRYAKTLSPITKEMEDQAAALRDAITDFNDAVGNLETKYGPQILGMLRQGAVEVKHTFDDVVKVVQYLDSWKNNPKQAFDSTVSTIDDAFTRGAQYNYDHWHGTGDFRPPQDAADGQARLDAMARERDALKARLDADRQKSPGGFPTRHADDFRRLQDLNGAIAALKDNVAKGAFSKEDPGPSWMEQWRKEHPDQPAGKPFPHPDGKPSFRPAPAGWTAPAPGDGRDHSLDGVVVGAIDKPILHLAGTLKTAAAAADQGPVRQAAFHPAGLLAPVGGLDPAGIIEAGVKAGVLAAFREWAGGVSSDASAGRAGVMPAAFHPDGGMGGGGGGGGGGTFNFSGFGKGGWEKSGASKAQVAAYIRHAFAAQGIDPSVALRIASAEGLHSYVGDHGTSFGAFQLHYGGSGIRGMNSRGLGDRFTAETGLDARDPTTYRQQIDFAAKIARREGWGAWHGRFPAHVGLRDGIGTYNGPVPNADDYDKTGNGPMAGLDKVGRLASEQCVALANAAVQFRGSVRDWRKGDGADAGTLKPGTPVATFLDRQGRETSRYAGGGIGTPGAHLDHAGVFQRYIMDGAGHRIGMTIAEQFKGSGGRHLRDYMFGRGWGEGNGSNYHAILGPDGKPLGGSRNPMSELHGAAAALRGAAADQRQAAAAVSRSSDRPDLGAERAKAGLSGPQAVKVAGGINAHVTLHDNGRSSTRVESSGHVRDAGITVRRAPQRTATV